MSMKSKYLYPTIAVIAVGAIVVAGRVTLGAMRTTTISGRGLILIAALAERWGTDQVDDGKIVWVDLLV